LTKPPPITPQTKPRKLLSDRLTAEEIEALRQRAKERAVYFQKAFAHLRPKADKA
jgi:hypothetical protein